MKCGNLNLLERCGPLQACSGTDLTFFLFYVLYLFIYLLIYAFVCLCTYLFIYVCIYVFIYVCIYLRIYLFISLRVVVLLLRLLSHDRLRYLIVSYSTTNYVLKWPIESQANITLNSSFKIYLPNYSLQRKYLQKF